MTVVKRFENSSNSSFVRGRKVDISSFSPFVGFIFVEAKSSCAVSRSASNSAALSRSFRSLGSSSTSDKSSPCSYKVNLQNIARITLRFAFSAAASRSRSSLSAIACFTLFFGFDGGATAGALGFSSSDSASHSSWYYKLACTNA